MTNDDDDRSAAKEKETTDDAASAAAAPGGGRSLPSSPAARAFFAALDRQSSSDGGGNADKDDKIAATSSAFIQKRIRTLGWRNRHSQDEYYPIDVDSVKFKVLQVQRGELEGTYGTGATVWPASVVLVKYLERHRDAVVAGKRVVDLGAGTGVTSIAAALLRAESVVCTDGEPKVVELARDNVRRVASELRVESETNVAAIDDGGNDDTATTTSTTTVIRGCPIQTQLYWWGSGPIPAISNVKYDDEKGDSEVNVGCDVVLVSDCVLPKLYPIAPLVEALDQLLRTPAAFALLSYEHRYYPDYDPRDKFRELAAAKDLRVGVIPIDDHDPVYSVDDIELWKVERN